MKWRNGWIGAAALILTACGGDDEQQKAQTAKDEQPATGQVEVWRFGLEEIEGSVQYEYANRFAEIVSEKTDGQVEVRLFPYGQLGGLTDIYDQVQAGSVQLAFGSGFLGGTVPESQLFSLNFILTDDELRNTQILNDEAFRKNDDLIDSFRERSLHPLAIVPEGWQVWTANKAVRTPEDFAGLAIRTMDNRLLRETYSAYGANPTTMEYGELYSGLQLGQLDGNIQPVFAHQEMDFYQVQDYMIFANQAQFIATVMANADWYDNLSDEHEQVIEDAVVELVPYIHEVQTRLNTERLNIITENSDIEVIRLTPEERAVFRERSLPVRDVFVDMVGDRGENLLNALLELVEEGAPESADEPVPTTETNDSIAPGESPTQPELDHADNASDDAAESVTP
ncbi:C4-dicarboxylate ABC transporter substrate-binding protein [Pseudomonas sp. G11-1]|uniref:TRAP transporter substrate-binding protein DctP n=1 Tax=Halopseudomonas sp. SMJS2 TaxID=3041098 RepID=UPI00044C8895|nr:TRAP transporter substrate-binding protein DctP [Halopseudomonas sp. SMJS2]EZQ14014.1 C4-dicarboxylate ABC transporter substrate-binding protein [Halopseudomonas bauzanensis]MCO5784860.1 C4-dicarboxylate ABC transporter substrate-binding protein [Pseudomonas sp. G11-1]MCO5789037.1 C4-dicarboxylate ABC transporter substrate-binding protein [Pseudomonas sp. G11-2]WGK60418.1 TRAP transporter substrate-binding protein DctP [Halopseudomonas sp. SMJS2]